MDSDLAADVGEIPRSVAPDSEEQYPALVMWDGPSCHWCYSGLQMIRHVTNDAMYCLTIPGPSMVVTENVTWGDFATFYTPAFWRAQVWFRELRGDIRYALGRGLLEEAAACLLGGYGFRAELGLAAFHRLRDRGLLDHGKASLPALQAALEEPLPIGNRSMHYRFPRQKARYLQTLIEEFSSADATQLSDRALRDWLMTLPGIGYKTASWITRNARASDSVAILDIHVIHACRLFGLFNGGLIVGRDYEKMESLFLHFSQALGVSPALLDATMWEIMRVQSPRFAQSQS